MNVADWEDFIKLQKYWIGECNGYNFELPLAEDDKITTTIWTMEPESLKTALFVGVKSCHIPNKPEWRLPDSNRLSIHIRIPFSNRLLPVFVVEDDKLDYPEGMTLCWVTRRQLKRRFSQQINFLFQLMLPLVMVQVERKYVNKLKSKTGEATGLFKVTRLARIETTVLGYTNTNDSLSQLWNSTRSTAAVGWCGKRTFPIALKRRIS